MPGKEKWALVYLGSQQMHRTASSARVSRLSVSCDYGKNKQKTNHTGPQSATKNVTRNNSDR